MYNDQIERNIETSNNQRKNLMREFIAYDLELKANRQVSKMRKKVEETREAAKVCQERDNVIVEGLDGSVGNLIKNKAIDLHRNYHALSTNGKAIVSLGLNSTLDLSFDHPQSQSTLFNNRQWKASRKRYSKKNYIDEDYSAIAPLLDPLMRCYNEKKSFETN